ncbi:hypothetical protein RNZ50_23690 [Paracoccaceae bacterium Fryx2]|nr:hypothetical protein [Paracoccaceae bacterium Fryx2]
MRILIILFFFGLSFAASAATVVVKSGEHDGFSRLVLELSEPSAFVMGRTEDGYELRLSRNDFRFDLTRVFRLIPRDRLAAIWVDPKSGALRLGIGCACHAIPFEFRPGLIVIDLKDGPPPAGSSFELALDPAAAAMPLLTGRATRRPHPRPETPTSYDWRTAMPRPAVPAVSLPGAGPDMAPLRDALLRQISDGAARGVVDATMPPLPQVAAEPRQLAQVRIGQDLGMAAGVEPRAPGLLTAKGANCLPDERLDIASWGQETPIVDQMADALAGLTGEFDKVQDEALARAVRFYLYLGFGAEARQLLQSLNATPEDRRVWEAMAEILDERMAVDAPFAGMEVCDTAAALWSVLARPQLGPADRPHSAAVLRSFSALPLHLRRHLGPILSERFLSQQDTETARAIRDAILRAPGDPGPAVRLMEARLDLAQGDTAAADTALTELSAGGGATATKALIDFVDSRVAQDKPIDAATVTAVAALAHEHRGTEIGVKLLRAQALALAGAGEFREAFDLLSVAPGASAELWRMLAGQGTDADLMALAILPAATPMPQVAVPTRRKLTERLVGLGFSEAALAWLPQPVVEGADRLLAAAAEMQRRDGRAALRVLAGLETAEADALRAQAQTLLGDPAAAAAVYATLGEAEAEQRSSRQAQDWARLAAEGAEPWRTAAGTVSAAPAAGPAVGDAPLNAADANAAPMTVADTTPVPPADANAVPETDPPGPLARSRQALAESAGTRQALEALLSGVPAPGAP